MLFAPEPSCCYRFQKAVFFLLLKNVYVSDKALHASEVELYSVIRLAELECVWKGRYLKVLKNSSEVTGLCRQDM